MRYLFVNLRNFIRHNTIIFSLFVICQVVSAFVILLSYGAFQNFQLVKNTQLTNSDLIISFGNVIDNYEIDGVTYSACDGSVDNKKVKELLSLLSPRTLSSMESICFWATGKDKNSGDLSIAFRLEYSSSKNDFVPFTTAYDNSPVQFGKIYSADEYIKGEKLIVLPSYYTEEYIGKDFFVNGDKYLVCGIDALDDCASIPFKNSPDNLENIVDLYFTSETVMNQSVYDDIVSSAKSVFGDYAVIPKIDTISDNLPFYNSIIALTVMLSVLSAITLMLLYNYILSTRNKTIAIFRIFGCTIGKAIRIFLSEIMLTAFTSFSIVLFVYLEFIKERLKTSFVYINQVYNARNISALFILYMLVTMLISSVMVYFKVRLNPVVQLKSGDKQ